MCAPVTFLFEYCGSVSVCPADILSARSNAVCYSSAACLHSSYKYISALFLSQVQQKNRTRIPWVWQSHNRRSDPRSALLHPLRGSDRLVRPLLTRRFFFTSRDAPVPRVWRLHNRRSGPRPALLHPLRGSDWFVRPLLTRRFLFASRDAPVPRVWKFHNRRSGPRLALLHPLRGSDWLVRPLLTRRFFFTSRDILAPRVWKFHNRRSGLRPVMEKRAPYFRTTALYSCLYAVPLFITCSLRLGPSCHK